MAMDIEVLLASVERLPGQVREPGGHIVRFKVRLLGQPVDSRFPLSFEVPVPIIAGFCDDAKLVEFARARLVSMVEALSAAIAGWQRDDEWWAANRLPKAR